MKKLALAVGLVLTLVFGLLVLAALSGSGDAAKLLDRRQEFVSECMSDLGWSVVQGEGENMNSSDAAAITKLRIDLEACSVKAQEAGLGPAVSLPEIPASWP